jgi:demethoxyubiquinone hydroxylase (CLK1/Coq7/Cat5 family)
MDSREFAKTIERQVAEFCASLDAKLPAYSYIPLTTDEMRIKVMQSRLFNEVRAGEIFGGWLKSTLELDVKKTLAEATHEEYVHATYLEEALQQKGAVPHDYQPLPAQMAMFNGFEGLTDTVERIAAFPMAGEGVADYLIAKSLKSAAVPKWVTEPYQKIHADEEEHGNYPFEILVKYATTADKQERAARAVAMSLVLRRSYFDNLDRWVYEDKIY